MTKLIQPFDVEVDTTVFTLVEITLKDIQQGYRGNCKKCPIARALGRVLIAEVYPEVTADAWYIREMATMKILYNGGGLSVYAARFVQWFDLVKPVEPTSFHFNIPKRFLR